jgi:hypothetical protein
MVYFQEHYPLQGVATQLSFLIRFSFCFLGGEVRPILHVSHYLAR